MLIFIKNPILKLYIVFKPILILTKLVLGINFNLNIFAKITTNVTNTLA